VTAGVLKPGSLNRQRDEARSFAAVVALIAVALVAGLLLRMSAEGGVERVDQGGLDAAVPVGWVLLPAAGDRLLTAYDPLDPDLRYGVSAVDAAAGVTLTPEDAAARRLEDRSQLLDGFAIVSEGLGSLGTVATYDVTYSFVDHVPGGATTPIDAVEHYFGDGSLFPEDRVLVVVLEASPDEIERARPAFDRFAQDIVTRTGTAAASTPVTPSASDARVASVDGSLGPRRASLAATADLIKGTVQVFLTATVGGREQAVGWGSGTIISRDGLILTNAHVAMPSAAGLGVYEADPTPAVDPEDLVVAVIGAEDEPAVPTYRASVIAADGYLDAAVIRIDRDLDGQRISPSSLDLPTVPIGESDSVRVGDPVTVVGFPGIGGNTISLSSGRASGFLGDDRIGPRAWIKTDAVVSQGNSGGLATNDAGELIGVPTRGPSDTGGYSLLRPIALLSGVLDAGRAGRRSVDSRYLVPSTGRERLSLDTWTDSLDACPAATRLSSYPSRARQIVAGMDHAGFASGEDVVSQWRLDGEVVYRSGRMLASGSEQGGCLFDAIYHDRGLPDGSYVIEVFAGPRLKPVLSAQTTVGSTAQAGSVSLSGRIIDADSGRPIARAVIFMLTPGTDPVAWQTSPSDAQVAAYAQTVSDGTFTVMGLQAGTSYPALAVADGYVAASGTIGPLGDGGNELVSPISLTRASS
jgi:S1-C subfamily serine protease